MEHQDSLVLDPSLAPLLLLESSHGGGAETESCSSHGAVVADETTEETTDDDGAVFLYRIPKRQLLPATSGFFDYLLNSDTSWITPQGWVLMVDPSTRAASLRDPFTSRTVRLPSDQERLLPASDGYTRCLLSTHQPADPGCVVLVIHLKDPVLWYCGSSAGDSRWLRYEHQSELIAKDFVSWAMGRLTAAGGKFYTFLEQDNKLVALEFSPGPIFSTTHAAVITAPWPPGFYQAGLVESCGDLFVVRFSFERSCCLRTMDIYVYKLVSSRNAWVKVDKLGDTRVFFFGRDMEMFGASMAADDEVGLKANCIYFTRDHDKGLYVYDTMTWSKEPPPYTTLDGTFQILQRLYF
ncbi:hypothetical protein U9M48_014289 [Paspalum notatum var. saurae]|uniref:KIB1-4 beta-propeller domain-containing protein n=1 Tax=Paspalum notatum var. saurae TaxID=547442 RepID=A0AAQ3T2D1_PASNO